MVGGQCHTPAALPPGKTRYPLLKQPGRGTDHPPPPKRQGHERVELYLYSPSGPQWPVIGRTLPLTVVLHFFIPSVEVPTVDVPSDLINGQNFGMNTIGPKV